MAKNKLILTALIFFLVNVMFSYSQNQNTIPQSKPDSSKEYISQRELLDTYKEVLLSSKSSVDHVKSTTETVLWLVGAAFVLLTAEGMGALSLLMKATRSINNSMRDINEAKLKLDIVMHDADISKIRIQTLTDTLSKIDTSITDMNNNIISANRKINALTMDLDWYKDIKNLEEVRQNIMGLYSSDKNIWSDASNSIRELLKNDKPIVRGFICDKLYDFLTDIQVINEELKTRLFTVISESLKNEGTDYNKVKMNKLIPILHQKNNSIIT